MAGYSLLDGVVPHAGTWIEMGDRSGQVHSKWSCLTQARGLKSLKDGDLHGGLVVPHAGTWIEI